MNPSLFPLLLRYQAKGLVQPVFCVFICLPFCDPNILFPCCKDSSSSPSVMIRFIMFVGVPVLGRPSMRSSKQECKWKLNIETEKKKVTVLLMATSTACDPERRWFLMIMLLIIHI